MNTNKFILLFVAILIAFNTYAQHKNSSLATSLLKSGSSFINISYSYGTQHFKPFSRDVDPFSKGFIFSGGYYVANRLAVIAEAGKSNKTMNDKKEAEYNKLQDALDFGLALRYHFFSSQGGTFYLQSGIGSSNFLNQKVIFLYSEPIALGMTLCIPPKSLKGKLQLNAQLGFDIDQTESNGANYKGILKGKYGLTYFIRTANNSELPIWE